MSPFNSSYSIHIFLILAIGGAITVCATDIYVPSLPIMTCDLSTTTLLMQDSLAIGMLGICIGAPLWGPLADNYGRKPILTIGMMLFALSSFLCSTAHNIVLFLIYRFLQGFGASAMQSLAGAVINDVYAHHQAAKYMAYMGSITTFCLIVAPAIGGLCTSYINWRASFVLLGLAAAIIFGAMIFFLRETLPKTQRPKFNLKQTIDNHVKVLGNWQFWSYNIIPSVILGSLINYQTNVSFIFAKELNIEPAIVGALLSLPPIANCICSTVIAQYIDKIGFRNSLNTGIGLCIVGSLALYTSIMLFPLTPSLIIASITIFGLSLSFIFPPIMTLNFELFGGMRGVVGAMGNVTRVLVMALSLKIGSYMYNGEMSSIANNVVFTTIFNITLYLILLRFGKFRN